MFSCKQNEFIHTPSIEVYPIIQQNNVDGVLTVIIWMFGDDSQRLIWNISNNKPIVRRTINVFFFSFLSLTFGTRT